MPRQHHRAVKTEDASSERPSAKSVAYRPHGRPWDTASHFDLSDRSAGYELLLERLTNSWFSRSNTRFTSRSQPLAQRKESRHRNWSTSSMRTSWTAVLGLQPAMPG